MIFFFFQIEAALSFLILYLPKRKANLSRSAVFELALGFFLEEIMQLLRGTCLPPSQGDLAPCRMYLW